ncbi:MAG: hypothetical protein Q8R70_07725 [Methanoregula sp.]|nr:hypothetical protein [Methanoregula sp.]
MAEILYQKNRRIERNHSRQSYLVDIRSGIEIPLMMVYPLFENHLMNPPFPNTRFFEVEIDEVRKDGRKHYALQAIVPVHARKKPDWRILKFTIRRGSWTITERLHMRTPEGEVQWLYTDDFNILFLASGGRHDAEILIHLVTGKLDAIAQSILSGSRIPSEFENQQVCRNAFGTLFSRGVDGAVSNAVIYRQHSHAGKTDGPGVRPAGADIPHNHGKGSVILHEADTIRVDLDQIEELRDLSWLTD